MDRSILGLKHEVCGYAHLRKRRHYWWKLGDEYMTEKEGRERC